MTTSASSSAVTQTVTVNDATFAYREFGTRRGIPLVCLHHFSAVLDDWDPATLDGFAARHRVITFDNRGVGRSSGSTPLSVREMANDTIAFIDALGFKAVDLFGFSLGGFVAQMVLHERPDLVQRAVLAGTAPAGGEGISNVDTVVQEAISRTAGNECPPRHLLFFTQTWNGQVAAQAYLRRLSERKNDRDTPVSSDTMLAQLSAIRSWGNSPPTPLETINQPVLVANGDNDIMVPTVNSLALARRIPNARLSIFPDSGHGGVFENHASFVPQVLTFLDT